MQTLSSGSRGIGLLVRIHLDRVLFPAAIGASLCMGGLILGL
ncbi:hypothetical protein PAA8504_00122 [Palleronia abyssalis]|uniref:Uncharacterized protein n=1 Tax=Palleronia abyssalis TaxID=1501240 RepID=A0A2R8BQ76_9RHOB|nr:hypothetical protein PAA8504_00122 [Palleronia abyssalis]